MLKTVPRLGETKTHRKKSNIPDVGEAINGADFYKVLNALAGVDRNDFESSLLTSTTLMLPPSTAKDVTSPSRPVSKSQDSDV